MMNNTHRLTHIRDVLGRRNKPLPGPIQTGFVSLDNLIGGLERVSINLIASRPGMGKSSFALNIANNMAKRSDISVAYISLAEPSDSLAIRLLSIETGINPKHISTWNYSNEEADELIAAEELLSKRNIYFADVCSLSATNIMTALRNIQNLDVVIIDYIQLLILDGKTQCAKGKRNRTLAVTHFGRVMKRLAIELNISIILLSQLDRSVEERDDDQKCYRPAVWDLSKSSLYNLALEADVVMFPYRASYYDQTVEESVAECIVFKNRHEKQDTIPLHWNRISGSFSDA